MFTIQLGILIGYVVLLYAVAFWSERLGRGGVVGYFLAGRGLPPVLVAVALAGLAVGGASTIGVAERAYRSGISAGWYNAAWAAGAFVVGLLAAGRLRALKLTTVPELFERHYDRAGRIIAVVGQLVIQMVITALQYVAGGAILSALVPQLFSRTGGMIATAVVFVGITVIGGMWAAGLSNVINVLVIYVGLIAGAIGTVSHAGGFAALALRWPAGYPAWDLGGVGWAIVAAWFAVMVTQAFSTQGVAQIGFAARDERAARRGFLLGALLILPVGFISALFGMVAAARYPGLNPAQALPRSILELHPALAGITLAGLWAADVSTAGALLLGSATLVVGDLVRPLLRRPPSPRGELLACRVAVLGVSAVTLLLALRVASILQTLLVGLSLTTAYTLVVLATLWAPRLCRRSSAWATLAAGIVVLALWQFVPASRVLSHPIYAEWLVCLAVFLLVPLFDRRPIACAVPPAPPA